ncbi:GldG family protein [Nannocystis pusilla]|uniref:GldG family protein n=1 Tax=Nannocystis pusilla TaxID=889268 RepID=UPI003B767F2A
MHPRVHRFIRFASIAVTAVSLTYMAQRANVRADVTAEKLNQVTSATRDLIDAVTPERPVAIHAFVSREVPRDYVTVRARLLSVLREMEARGKEGLTVRIVEPSSFSDEAVEAEEKYGIRPQVVANRDGDRVQEMQVFLGVAVTSGPHEQTIPFIDRGMSPEYELVRALRTVTQEKKKVVGCCAPTRPSWATSTCRRASSSRPGASSASSRSSTRSAASTPAPRSRRTSTCCWCRR